METLALFPETARVAGGALSVGGVAAEQLATELGTPLVVYCEETLRAQARAYRESAREALVLYGTKAFPNRAIVRLFAEEGLGADVSTLGELELALAAGIPGERIVVHGNNKSEAELRRAAEVGAHLVVVDALDEVDLAAAAGVERVLVRVTPGIDVDTHEAIRTGHRGSKFGLPPEQAIEAISRARELGLDVRGIHLHLGSQLLDTEPTRFAVDWLAGFAIECRDRLGWVPAVVDLGGGLGIQYVPDEPAVPVRQFATALLERLGPVWERHGLATPAVVMEPGRSLVGRAGVTLYRVGVVKHASETTTYVAVDGGMSDNPRPMLYDAEYVALLANRADEEPAGAYVVCGKHCESGDVLIHRAALPEPRRGDLLAIPATGAYTLGMASNYNQLPRPAAVLVRDGAVRLIRRRETLDDLARLDVDG